MGLFKEAPYKEATQNIIDVIGGNYKVFDTACTEEEVNRVYVEELERGKKEGFVPVLIPCDDVLNEWFHLDEDDKEKIKEKTTNEKRQAIIDAANDNGKELLQEWYNSATEDFADDESEMESFLGSMGGSGPINELSTFAMFAEDGEIQETILFEVPVDEPWKVIAWFPMGGWNECPWVDDMMAISHYWYEKYHAFPAVITRDVLQYFVENPESFRS